MCVQGFQPLHHDQADTPCSGMDNHGIASLHMCAAFDKTFSGRSFQNGSRGQLVRYIVG